MTQAKVIDLLNSRRVSGSISEAEGLEAAWWTAVPDPTDKLSIYGAKYWLPYPTSTTAGFYVGLPTGFSDVGGLNPNTYERWRPWGAVYASVDENDLLKKMAQGQKRTGFMAPRDLEEFKRGVGGQLQIWTNEVTATAFEAELRARNDNHSRLNEFAGATAFGRTPIGYAPKLDEETRNPVYWADMDYLWFASRTDGGLGELPPLRKVDQPLVWVVHNFGQGNSICSMRRRQQVYALAA